MYRSGGGRGRETPLGTRGRCESINQSITVKYLTYLVYLSCPPTPPRPGGAWLGSYIQVQGLVLSWRLIFPLLPPSLLTYLP